MAVCNAPVIPEVGHPVLLVVGALLTAGLVVALRRRPAAIAALVIIASAVGAGLHAAPASAAALLTPSAPGTFPFDTSGCGSGEGVLSFTMSGPGTSWADSTNTAVVIDAALDSGPAQVFVLYQGARTATYRGFTGPVGPGPHTVVARVRDDLSNAAAPTAVIAAVDLTVVPPSDPSYDALAHAPVLYGRSQNATSDVPTLQYVLSEQHGDGSRTHAFTEIWSNEDGGTGIIAANLWGSYGRMTDIENDLTLEVAPDGTVTGGSMAGCGYRPPADSVTCVDHQQTPFRPALAGNLFGVHPVIRVESANNTSHDQGTTDFRFQQVPVLGPAPGQVREAAMDAHPETYLVMDEEVQREQAATSSTDPTKPLAGDAPQFLIVDVAADLTNAVSLAVEVQLAGDTTWWSNDYAQATAPLPSTAYPFFTGGHGRTVIKLPTTWHGSAITAVRFRINHRPDQTGATADVHGLQLLELTTDYRIVDRPLPQPLAQIPVTMGISIAPAQPG